MKIKVRVNPKSSQQKVVEEEGEKYLVYLKSSPQDNKANVELVKLLKKFFNKNVRIKSGFTSKNKIIEVED